MANDESLAGLSRQEIELSQAPRAESQHILLALLRLPQSNAGHILNAHGVTRDRVLEEVERVRRSGFEESSAEPDPLGRPQSAAYYDLFAVWDLWEGEFHKVVRWTAGHELLRMLSVDSIAKRVLTKLGVTKHEVREMLSMPPE